MILISCVFVLSFCVLVTPNVHLCHTCEEFFVVSAVDTALVLFCLFVFVLLFILSLFVLAAEITNFSDFSLVMTSKQFNIRLIPKFSGVTTNLLLVKWLENVELVCDLCEVEYVLPL